MKDNEFMRCLKCRQALYLAPKQYRIGDHIRCSKCKAEVVIGNITKNGDWDIAVIE